MLYAIAMGQIMPTRISIVVIVNTLIIIKNLESSKFIRVLLI